MTHQCGSIVAPIWSFLIYYPMQLQRRSCITISDLGGVHDLNPLQTVLTHVIMDHNIRNQHLKHTQMILLWERYFICINKRKLYSWLFLHMFYILFPCFCHLPQVSKVVTSLPSSSNSMNLIFLTYPGT